METAPERATTKILIVDDHDVGLGFAGGLIGEPDAFPELPTVPRDTNLKWINDPQVARTFLRNVPEHNWVPDVILVDYEFVGSSYTGLCVLEASATIPAAHVSVFSGHSTDGGRALFAAAAHHWFGVEYDLDKSRTRRDLPGLLQSKPPESLRFNHRIRADSHLIDNVFSNPRFAGILMNWIDTGGAANLIAARIFESTSTVERASRELALEVKKFVETFALGIVPDLTRKGASQDLIRTFVMRNLNFIADPSLPETLKARFSD